MIHESAEGASFVAQFDVDDRRLVIELLRAIRFVSADHFASMLSLEIRAEAEQYAGKVAVYAVRAAANAIYFADSRARPDVIEDQHMVGSEALVANILTNLARGDPAKFLYHPSVAGLKRERVRNIIFVDDCSVSGTRVEGFLVAFKNNRTIRSWLSYNRIRSSLVAFAVGGPARTLLAFKPRSRSRNRLFYSNLRIASVVQAQPWPSPWTPQVERRVRDLCRRYGAIARARPAEFEGYKQSMGLIVFAHSCPNNVPAILWHTSSTWTPLFPNRAVNPRFAAGQGEATTQYALSMRAAALLALPNEVRLALEFGQMQMALLLGACRRGVRRNTRFEQVTGMASTEVRKVRRLAEAAGLIDSVGVLTAVGLAELHAIERSTTARRVRQASLNAFYYPKQLRAAREDV